MSYLQKKSETEYLIKINVKPNSKTQKIVDDGEFLTIFINSKPIQNKANKELIHLIKKRLKISSNQIHIISGLKSSEKIILINFSVNMEEKNIYNRLLK
ncbi:hypothetical protein LCGC14_0666910 [marine sediment metagenome]|uniref:Uncharacterized protein n=1 Tax=marine sediment metagenome TaxID=412755 RepID=A0A0F9U077_9ZZZZ